jgi:hypothetical protein
VASKYLAQAKQRGIDHFLERLPFFLNLDFPRFQARHLQEIAHPTA